MEKKRKLPARASARQEQAKRRNVATRGRSPTPEPPEPPREPTPAPPTPPPPPPPLPKSVEAGKLLPTVEVAQPKDLSTQEYQSLAESGVMAESLSRSRQKWIGEGLFEKYWTKPHKRKGVLQEDPNNPPKDSMMKVGTVRITIEPHIVEATMFAVKTSKLPPHQQQRLNPQGAQKPQQTAQQPQASVQGQTNVTLQPGQQQAQVTPVVGQAPAKAAPQPGPVLARPVLQYGPPNGSMPPPPMPTTASAGASPVSTTAVHTPAGSTGVKSESPAPATVSEVPSVTAVPPVASALSTQASNQTITSASTTVVSPSATPSVPPKPAASPNPGANVSIPSPSSAPQPVSSGLAAPVQPPPAKSPSPAANGPPRSSVSQSPLQAPLAAPQPLARPPSNPPLRQTVSPAPTSASPTPPGRPATGTPGQTSSPAAARPGAATPVPAAKPAANDPVIAMLAQKASRDPALRDLMKRVAVGEAKDGELAKFQKIIDQLNAEYRQKGGQQGPSADRLMVDGRTVKYFADEVRTILDIVLASNPNQKSSELRPPPRSDPLVVLLVKTALEDQRTKDMIRRIAEGKPGFNDATDLKQILDRLHRDAKITPKAQPQPTPSPLRQPAMNPPANTSAKANKTQPAQQGNPQALRSKGPTPSNRPDISAVVFDFGTGDRYLFPKYSVLEFLPSQSGQQVVASFLIVRKGSTSEYGGDPKLDYYQPVSIRLQTQGGRHLENLARVVAPQDEVRRYMDDVMDNMTRAEYVLLAMRLPREDFDPEQEVVATIEESKASSPTPKSEPEPDQNPAPKPGVLWTTGSSRKSADPSVSVKFRDPEQEAQSKYERLIRAVAGKDVDLL